MPETLPPESSPHPVSVWAIGDIHGQADLLDALLGELPRRPDDYTVYLGDYINRGPSSREVVDRLLQEYDRAPERTVLLWGNHEVNASSYFRLPNPLAWRPHGPVWPPAPFLATLKSYGVTPSLADPGLCPPPLARLCSLLRPFWRCPLPGLEHVLFVHAGVRPGLQPEESDPEDLFFIRKEFTGAEDTSGRLVIFGHTHNKSVFQRPDKIGIDTGAGHGGALTALQLPSLQAFKAYPDGRVVSHPLLRSIGNRT